MKVSEFKTAGKLITGLGAIKALADEMTRLGIKDCAVVTDKGVSSSGLLEQVLALLPYPPLHIIDDIPPEPAVNIIEAKLNDLRENKVDGIIALGGGSAIDSAKVLAATYDHSGSISKLFGENTLSESELKNFKTDFKNLLDDQYKNAKDYKPKIEWYEGSWSRYKPEKGKDKRGVSGFDQKKLLEISEKINSTPEKLNLHKTIIKILNTRRASVSEGKNIDWSTAEALAFGSLLEEGYPVRLVGQDSGRGTFSQRHSVLRNQEDNSRYVPLNNISKVQKRYEIVDSFLSELAVLGFEYGYSLVQPNTLTMWEAQFGDFANGAQVVIDQFIASGERKWTRASGLVMLLPHGYEGQGPEHSSARLERFLQLCANDNMQIVNCTTPANYFHALRRQMHREFRKPLIIMTPKSLLRNKHCVSNIEDFDKDTFFHRILWDHALDEENGFIKLKESSKIKKVILCSGKVYFDLLDAREKLKKDDVVLYRVEQLYPFPVKSLVKEIKKYAKNAKFYWCQEEPKNMGGWFSVRDYIQWTLETINANNKEISYIGRSPDASPATGYAKRHIAQQQEIINKVFE